MSPLRDNSAKMDFTQLLAQTHVERHPPSDAVQQISPRDTSSKLYGDYYKLCSTAAYTPLRAAAIASHVNATQLCISAFPFFSLFEQERQTS